MYNDQIRRDARASQIEHEAAMPQLRTALNRFLDRDDRTEDETQSVLLNGLTRRRLFRVGGLSIAGAAVLAACGSSKSDNKGATTTLGGTVPGTTGTTMPGTTPGSMAGGSGDVQALRTASSIEELAVAAYQTAIDSGLVTTKAIVDAAKLFQSQHKEHSAFFQSATTKAGGQPFNQPNPVVLASLQPTIKALKTEKDVVMLALALETAAAQTYQSGVGHVTDLTLNKALMSVGGVEARHAAVLASVLGQDPVPLAFGGADKAIAFGTGV